ncbi:UMP-CMP kinase [Coemansia sp. Benny D115]|nr:UMP-CMP kinase [Coemansia sp. Benny D115]
MPLYQHKQHSQVRSDCVRCSPAGVPFRVPQSFSRTVTPSPTPQHEACRSTASLAPVAARPMFIGIAGGRGAGKEHTCRNIIASVRQRGHSELAERVLHLHLDDFHREMTAEEQQQLEAGREEVNLDHPESFDFELLQKVLQQLAAGHSAVEVPVWDGRARRRAAWRRVEGPAPRVVLVEGTLVLFVREVRALLDMQVFLDVDSDTRLGRQVRAALAAADGKSVDLKRWLDGYLFVAKPSFEEFVWPTKRWADVIIPKGDSNDVAIGLIAQRLIDLGHDDEHEHEP